MPFSFFLPLIESINWPMPGYSRVVKVRWPAEAAVRIASMTFSPPCTGTEMDTPSILNVAVCGELGCSEFVGGVEPVEVVEFASIGEATSALGAEVASFGTSCVAVDLGVIGAFGAGSVVVAIETVVVATGMVVGGASSWRGITNKTPAMPMVVIMKNVR